LTSAAGNLRSPVFIVGSARSGTSATVNAFIAVGYHGFREGHFLPLAHRIDNAIDQHFSNAPVHNARVLMANLDKGSVKGRIHHVFRDIVNDANPQSPWFDKTGGAEMIRFLPQVFALWPTAGAVFLKRRAIENILSRIKKFPKHSFDHHCADWAKTMSAWREVRERLPRDRYMEIDQYDMINNVGATASALSGFLGVTGENGNAMEAQWQKTRPQETEANSAKRIWTLDSTGWSEQQRETFRQFCVPEMTAFGYTLDADYRAVRVPL
jgi:hypothetical protein